MVVGVLGFHGCSVWNRVDACEADPPQPLTINKGYGGQSLSTSGAAASLTGGESMVAFDSEVPLRGVEVHLARFYADGGAKTSCLGPREPNEVAAAIDLTGGGYQLRARGVIAAPSGPSHKGLVVFEQGTDAGIFDSVWGRFIDEHGCAVGLAPFRVSTAVDATGVKVPSVVRMSDGQDTDDVLVFWAERRASVGGLVGQARRVRYSDQGPVFVPADGVVTLPIWGAGASLATVPMEKQVAVFWEESEMRFKGTQGVLGRRTWLLLLDSNFETVSKPFLLNDWHPVAEATGPPDLVAAFDGSSALVVWLQLDETDGRSRLFARAVSRGGQPIARGGAPDGAPLRLGHMAGVTDSLPALVALPNGGFLVGWTQTSADAAGGAELRAIFLNGDGAPRFNARACGTDDFPLQESEENAQGQATFAFLPPRRVLAAWTGGGSNETYATGSVQGAVLELDKVLPDWQRPRFAPQEATPPTSLSGCATELGMRTAGMPCACSIDCAAGGRCMTEESVGYPKGECVFECDVDAGLPCRAGEVCSLGFCYLPCETISDCSAGRRCFVGLCKSFCTSDDECASGRCDHYRGKCSDGTPSSGAGLDAPCTRHEDCRSRFCFPATSTCETDCVPLRPSCPEDGQCHPLSGSTEEGACHRVYGPGTATGQLACEKTLDCRPGAGARCLTEASTGYPRGACVIRCDDEHPCSAAERCVGHYCYTLCETQGVDAGCPSGRMCSQGVCLPHCTNDAECNSKQCDVYRGDCVGGSSSSGLGLDAKCSSDDDCRSGNCVAGTSTCATICQVSEPACPEEAECYAWASNDDVGVCHQPPSARPGLPCQYPWECDEGATCTPEAEAKQATGTGRIPRGICVRACQADAAPCSPGESCLNGICWTGCDADGQCPPGRACWGGVCSPFCVEDSECESGHCNQYTNSCDDGVASDGGGVDAECEVAADCRSGFCAGQCLVTCKLSNPKCPEGARCLGSPTSTRDQGTCHRADQGALGPCLFSQNCRPGGGCATEELNGFPGGACVFDCASDGDCGDGEACSPYQVCVRRCTQADQCGNARMCDFGICWPFCAHDSDCGYFRHCNTYTGRCDDGAAPSRGGIDARCDAGTDCNSDVCEASACVTFCRTSAPNCPEGAQCFAVDGGIDEGLCHRP